MIISNKKFAEEKKRSDALKKGNQVKILRKESYWYNDTGSIVKLDTGIKYPVLVRFEKETYSGVNSSNFAENEILVVSTKK